jgi:6-phospho-3-hexuloisomerase
MELNEIVSELDRTSAQISEAQIQALIDQIDSHKRIFVYGTGRSGLMLKTFAMRLMQIGRTAYVVGETTTPAVEPGDLLIVASASGTTRSVVDAAASAVKQGVDVVAITGKQDSDLSAIAEPLIRIEVGTKHSTSANTVQPLGSLFEQMLLIIFDGTILRMSRRQADTNSAMARRHASIE